MFTISMFDHLLNWRLLDGSHEFPGPDGGTCINEAAIVAAGFEYRQITSWRDCPPCFSPVVASFAVGLNDRMPDALRQELLMPFVTRLAGTRDTDAVEIARGKLIALRCIQRILPIVLRLRKHEERLETATAADAYAVAAAAANAYAAAAAAANAQYAHAAACTAADAHAAAKAAAAAAANAADATVDTDADAARRQIWTIATEILDETIKLGKHGDEVDMALVAQRMAAAKQQHREMVPC